MGKVQSADNRLMKLKTAAVIAVLCLVSGLLNTLVSYFINGVLGLPLYFDTLFTVAVLFSAGLVPALITAILLPVFTTFEYTYLMNLEIETAWWTYLFVFCVIALIFQFCKPCPPAYAGCGV